MEKTKDCPNIKNHTESPEDYVGWHVWAEEMSKDHHQIRCPECGLYVIWVKGRDSETADLKQELEITDYLLDEVIEVLKMIPECPVHGYQCFPHIREWITEHVAMDTAVKDGE